MLVEKERVGYWVTLKVILGIFENFKSIFFLNNQLLSAFLKITSSDFFLLKVFKSVFEILPNIYFSPKKTLLIIKNARHSS